MIQAFDELLWHDAVLLGVRVDRRDAGHRDEVCIDVEWPGGEQQCVRFVNVYAANLRLNFGLVGPDSIREGLVLAEHPELLRVRSKWSRVGVDLSDLKLYRLSTNSTSSDIDVFALDFVLDAPPRRGA